MAQGAEPEQPAEVERLRERIERWRQARGKRGPMPAPLWTSAVALARRRGVYATAKGLRIDFGSLRRRLAAAAERTAPSREREPTFVEIAPPAMFGAAGPGVSVELSRPDGARLTVRLGAEAAFDVGELVRELWGRRP